MRSDRTDGAINEATKWNTGFPKDVSANASIEINGDAKIWMVEEFVIPDADKIGSISLPIVYSSGNKADISVYAFPYDIPTSNEWNSTYRDNVVAAKTGTVLATLTSSSTSFTISGDDLLALKTTFSSFIAGNKLTLRLLFWTAARADIHGQTTARPDRRPHLEVIYTDAPNAITNEAGDVTYTDLANAFSDATSDDVIILHDDCFINSRLTFATAKNITYKVAEGKDVTIYRWVDFTNPFILSNQSTQITFDGSATGASLTLDNQKYTGNYNMFQNEKAGTFSLKNVTIKNYAAGESVLKNQSTGKYTLANVNFENCSPTVSLIYNTNSNNDLIYLSGALNITDCTVTKHVTTNGRLRITPDNSRLVLSSTPLIIDWTGTKNVGTNIMVKMKGNSASDFAIVTDGCDLYQNNEDLKLTQIYNLAVSDAGAATLILPFESNIPDGISAYKLNYNSGDDHVTATEVTTTLPANTPVLINAEKDNYKFITTAAANSAFATGSDPVTYGALTGVYEATTVPSGSYVLYADATHKIGFYPAGSDVIVGANRAYLTAEGAGARLAIVYGDETNAIEAVKAGIADDTIYTLSGVRVEQPTRGIYVKNGKKFIVK